MLRLHFLPSYWCCPVQFTLHLQKVVRGMLVIAKDIIVMEQRYGHISAEPMTECYTLAITATFKGVMHVGATINAPLYNSCPGVCT